MQITPVECACRAFGSARRLAFALRIPPAAVARWKAPRNRLRRGQAGDIPTPKLQRRILFLAALHDLQLSALELVFGREVPGGDLPRRGRPQLRVA
jgi:hypothetical protein